MSIYHWSTTAASNSTADASINWSEGMAPSAVNDSARAEMAAIAKWRNDISGTLTTSGTSTAYTLTTSSVFSSAALMSGAMITIIPHTTSGVAPTLAVDGLTARAINISTGVAVPTGALVSGTPYVVTYIHASTEFILQGIPGALPAMTLTGTLTGTAATFSTTLGVTGISSFGDQLKAANGTVSLPSFTFTNDPDCGFYRIGANNLGLALNGAKVVDYATTGVAITGLLSTTTSITAGNGFTVSAGAVSLPAGSVAAAALAAPASRVKLATNSPSGASSSTFEGLISATYRSYEFEFSDIVAASGTPNFIMQVGTGAGPTYDTGSNYHYTYAAIGGGSVSNANSAGTTSFLLTPITATVGQGASGVIRLFVPNGAAAYKPINYHSHNATTAIVGAGRYLSVTAVTAVRFLTSSGNFTGTIVMYGIT